ncbi:MAG: InlB B-repeat-containing protein, partial [Lachnospiraceae bacterium]|nr:InlB B-repeat-containing protein [Lachnospiraceae bacterium]
MRTKKHLVKSIVTFVLAIALVIGMIPVMPGSIKAQAYSKSGFLWDGKAGSAFVNTNLDDELIGSDWYVITDNADGGKSKVVFNQANPYGDGSTISNEDIAMYSGISGTAVLDKGTLKYNPYVYICFDICGKYEDGSPIPADVSNYWDGLVISYMCDCNATLELGLGDDVDARIGYENPSVDLKANDKGKVETLLWRVFKQPAWLNADQKIDIEKAVTTLATVKIKIQAPDSSGGTFHFMIDRIGTWGSSISAVVLEDQGYIITYEGVEGASFENSNPDRYTIKDSITLNNPSKAGYEFTGWT